MATRPIFIPQTQKPYVKEMMLDFEWHAGFATSQAQKSIQSLHHAAIRLGISPVLEISSKAPSLLGVHLSAFNLQIRFPNQGSMSVECAFQGSKVFENGGPYTDLYTVSSIEAKKDYRLRTSGAIIGFNILGEDFPSTPLTAFYDWLYLIALTQNADLATELQSFEGFTDIAFNPATSINCQARSAALYVALERIGLIKEALQNKQSYLAIVTDNGSFYKKEDGTQLGFPWST